MLPIPIQDCEMFGYSPVYDAVLIEIGFLRDILPAISNNTVFEMPPKVDAKPSVLRGLYERRLLGGFAASRQ